MWARVSNEDALAVPSVGRALSVFGRASPSRMATEEDTEESLVG